MSSLPEARLDDHSGLGRETLLIVTHRLESPDRNDARPVKHTDLPVNSDEEAPLGLPFGWDRGRGGFGSVLGRFHPRRPIPSGGTGGRWM
jgi:hypothetical protein